MWLWFCLSRIGAHITIFSRRPSTLEKAKQEIIAACSGKDQEINAVAIDMSDASKVVFLQSRVKLKRKSGERLTASPG